MKAVTSFRPYSLSPHKTDKFSIIQALKIFFAKSIFLEFQCEVLSSKSGKRIHPWGFLFLKEKEKIVSDALDTPQLPAERKKIHTTSGLLQTDLVKGLS